MSAATARSAWFHRSKEVVGEGDVLVVDGEGEMDDVRQGAVLVAAWDETWGSVMAWASRRSTRVSSEQDGNLKLEQERLRKGAVEGLRAPRGWRGELPGRNVKGVTYMDSDLEGKEPVKCLRQVIQLFCG